MNNKKEINRKNASLGGLAKGAKYKSKRRKAIELFITKPELELNDIAEILGVSRTFVCDYTKNDTVKALRYSRVFENYKSIETLTDEDFETLIKKSNLKLQ